MPGIPLKAQREFVQLYTRGWGIKRIARKTGYSFSGIRKRLLKAGIKLRKPIQLKVTPRFADEFRRLYKDGRTMREIGTKFDISWRTVQRWLHRYRVHTYGPGRPKQIPDSARKLTKEKSYVLGVVGPGDGFLEYKRRQGVYRIKLDVTEREFATYFVDCLQKVYGLTPKIEEKMPREREKKLKYVVTLQSKQACDDVLRYGVSFRERDWRVPDIIKCSAPENKASYIQGIADSQGSVPLTKKYKKLRQVIISSRNVPGLKDLRELMNDFNVRTNYVKNRKIITGIRITDRKSLENFSTYINFTLPRKKDRLERFLQSYECRGKE